MRQGAHQPGQVFVVNDEGQMVLQGAQGGDNGGSEAGGGDSGPRTRKGAQQRARDIVREGLGQLRDWGSEIVAEVRVLQASQPTSSTKRTATEAGGGTVQSSGTEQGRVSDPRLHEKGAITWMVRAAPDSILGRNLSRGRRNETENEKEGSGGHESQPKASTGVQSRVAQTAIRMRVLACLLAKRRTTPSTMCRAVGKGGRRRSAINTHSHGRRALQRRSPGRRTSTSSASMGSF